MSEHKVAGLQAVRPERDIRALLKVSIGSKFVPFMLLMVTAMAFVAYWLPPGREQLATEFERLCRAERPGVAGLTVMDLPRPATGKGTRQRASGVVVAGIGDDAWSAAGLKAKDVITQVNGQPVLTKAQFAEMVFARVPADGPVTMTIDPAAPRQITVQPPAVSKPVAEGGSWKDGVKHYRDWCASPSGPSFASLRDDFETRKNIWTELPLNSFAYEQTSGIKDILRLVAAHAKAFGDDLYQAVRSYGWTGLAVILSAALFALIPGIAGLIYRRAFWSWFGIAFVGFLAMRSLFTNAAQVLNDNSDVMNQTAAALAASIVIFVLAQVAVVLLAHRLRRHSARAPFIASLVPVKWYNRTIVTGLAVLGGGMALYGWGDWLWKLPVMPFDSGSWLKWNAILLGLPFVYALLKLRPAWAHRAPKNIVVCLDGTSNTPDQLEKGMSAQTNVFKLFGMLKSDKGGSFAGGDQFDATLCKSYKDRQVALYYTGIGNKYDNDPLLGTIGQATGLGATGIVERAYLDVMRAWRPGDRVFIFGFSRGAASARILSRMIDQRGAPSALWSMRLLGRHWTLWPSRARHKVDVDVLGCWDTVGSFGVAKSIAGINFQQLAIVHDLTVSENVRQAYHMVALDEQRQEFEPTLMDPDPIHPERRVEVWFAGDHAGVGGGWATDRQSDVPLEFLLERVSSGYCKNGEREPGDESWGLYLAAVNGTSEAAMARAAAAGEAPGLVVIHPDPLGQLRTYFSNIYNYRPRQLPLHGVIHETVFERMTKSLPVYAPQSLFDLNDALDAKRDLIVAKVEKLKETNSMDEAERKKVLEFTDKLRLMRLPQYWEHVSAAHKTGGGVLAPAAALSNAALRGEAAG